MYLSNIVYVIILPTCRPTVAHIYTVITLNNSILNCIRLSLVERITITIAFHPVVV